MLFFVTGFINTTRFPLQLNY